MTRETMAQATARIAAEHRIAVAELIGRSRKQKISRARQEAYAACRAIPKSFPQIGKFFDGRDHASVIYGVRAHARRMASGAEQ